jgi:DnaJ-class molecular chaperone
MPTHYEVLGVSQDASEGDIKKAYRKLSLQYHPDRNPDPSVGDKYKSINDAYEILSDPQSREQYNMELKFGGPGGAGGFGAGFHPMGGDGMADINNIFNMMFGGGIPGMPGMGGFPGMGGRGFQGGPGIHVFHSGMPGGGMQEHIFQQLNKPPPIVKNVEITLEQAYHGASITINIEKQVSKNMIRYQEHQDISITIPQGIEENEVMVLRGQGHSISDDLQGDVKITFSIKNDTIFKRQGSDLIYAKNLILKESLCGFAFEIQHLNGKTLNMNNMSNPTIVKPNYKKVVPGLGFIKNGQTGNLIIELMVDFPDSLTGEQMDKLKEIL